MVLFANSPQRYAHVVVSLNDANRQDQRGNQGSSAPGCAHRPDPRPMAAAPPPPRLPAAPRNGKMVGECHHETAEEDRTGTD